MRGARACNNDSDAARAACGCTCWARHERWQLCERRRAHWQLAFQQLGKQACRRMSRCRCSSEAIAASTYVCSLTVKVIVSVQLDVQHCIHACSSTKNVAKCICHQHATAQGLHSRCNGALHKCIGLLALAAVNKNAKSVDRAKHNVYSSLQLVCLLYPAGVSWCGAATASVYCHSL